VKSFAARESRCRFKRSVLHDERPQDNREAEMRVCCSSCDLRMISQVGYSVLKYKAIENSGSEVRRGPLTM